MALAQQFGKALLWVTLAAAAASAQDDPPSRVLRLNYLSGVVSMQPAGLDDWAPAVINRPFTIGDSLYADQNSAAELHTDVAVMQMGQYTNLGILNLTDTVVQLRLTAGDFSVDVHDLNPSEVFEIDTPNAAVSLLRPGVYRFRVDPNANTTFVVTRSGQAEITGGGQAFTLDPGRSAFLSGVDQMSFDVEQAPAADSFDEWCRSRDDLFQQRHSRYLPPTLIGGEDLDQYGSWTEDASYGYVWYPTAVTVAWAPYHYGHWAWIEPWGWTWIDDAPWGFAPFHYGRWVYLQGRWGWAPGPLVVVHTATYVRPVYAPALVAWFGGAHWGVSVSLGGPSVGWVPLGFGEVYTPSYHVTPHYFANVNVYNTRIVNSVNITNVYKTVYVNKTVYNQTFVNVRAPNAVVAMQQNSFATGRPVHANAVVLQQAQVAHLQTAEAVTVAPPVAPTRQAVAPTLGRPAPRPPMQLASREVVAKTTPAPRPVSFTAQQSFFQQHAGQVYNAAEVRQTVAPRQQPATVRVAAPARPTTVQPGQHVGNAAHQGNAGHQPAPVPAARSYAPQSSAPAPATPPQRSNEQPEQHARQQQSQPPPAPAPQHVTEQPRSQPQPRVEARPPAPPPAAATPHERKEPPASPEKSKPAEKRDTEKKDHPRDQR